MPFLLITSSFVLGFFSVGKVIGFRSPSALFLVMQYVMALGTLPRLDSDNTSDERHKILLVITFILVSGTTALLALAEEHGRSKKAQVVPKSVSVTILTPNKIMVALIVVSIAISIAYFQAVGYNLLVESLAGNLGSSGTDVAGLRLAAYAGDTYFFPGYVNQFKNVLLPALTIIVIVWLYSYRKPFRLALSLSLATLCVVFLMGTGQRGALVTVLLMTVIFGGYLGRNHFKRTVVLTLTLGIPLFFVGSSVLGRSSDDTESASNFTERIAVQFNELSARMFESNQGASAAAFRYVDGMDIQWGGEWLQSITGLLPGVAGSSLSGDVFAMIYGSDRGTAPPSIWTSIYHNFGFIGAVIGAILLGLIYFKVSKKIYLTHSLNTLMAVGMAGVTTLMATWIAGGPEYFLNTGLAVFIFLWWWGSRIQKKDTKRMTESGEYTASSEP